MPEGKATILALFAAAILWFAVFEVLRRRQPKEGDSVGYMAIVGAIGTFLLMSAALVLALKRLKG